MPTEQLDDMVDDCLRSASSGVRRPLALKAPITMAANACRGVSVRRPS
jgi:hypothetical protein